MTYQQAALWLTDEEAQELLTEVRTAITARAGIKPGPDRTRRLFSLVAIPGNESAE